ncbi:MAG: hypothetical protein WCX31_02245 [Salinivirgaceae bacterium]
MKVRKKINLRGALFILCLWPLLPAIAQKELNVNEYTGTLLVNIPLYTIEYSDIVVPISVSYSATGNRVDDLSGLVGQGWNLNAGGSIVRINKGAPDLGEKWKDLLEIPVKGYGEGSDLNGALDQDGNFVSNTGGSIDFRTVMEKYIGDHPMSSNLEPDIFAYSFPGYSGQFLIDTDGIPHTLDGTPIKINIVDHYTIEIITPDGTTYVFTGGYHYSQDSPEFYKTRKLVDEELLIWETINLADEEIGTMFYFNEYDLRKIKSPNNKEINIDYSGNYMYNTSYSSTQKWIYDLDAIGYYPVDTKNQVQKSELVKSIISKITFGSNSVNFYFNSGNLLSKIEVKNENGDVVKRLVFNTYESEANTKSTWDYYDFQEYKYIPDPEQYIDPNTGWVGPKPVKDPFAYVINELKDESIKYRWFLNSIDFINPQDNKLVNSYIFDYNDTILPPKSSLNVDLWGYYNGSFNTTLIPKYKNCTNIDGLYMVPEWDNFEFIADRLIEHEYDFADRDANIIYMQAQVLNKITYPTKGYSTFEFQAHDCYNEAELNAIGGLRISKIMDFDENNVQINQTTYLYRNPENPNLSSGKLIVKPLVTTQYGYVGSYLVHYEVDPPSTDEVWEQKEELHRYGMSIYPFASSNYIGYDCVTSFNGNNETELGKVVKYFHNMVYDYSNLNTPIYSDKMNGLLENVEVFDARGDLQAEYSYGYSREILSTHYGLTFSGDFGYNPLFVVGNQYFPAKPWVHMKPKTYHFDCEKITLDYVWNEISKPNKGAFAKETYLNYNNSFHQKITKKSTIESDGTSSHQYIKYVSDYLNLNTLLSSAENGDSQSLAIKYMIDNNILDRPVETIFTVGDYPNEKQIGASLFYYSNSPIGGIGKPSSSYTKEILTPIAFNISTSWSSFQINSSTNTVEMIKGPGYVLDGSIAYNSDGQSINSINKLGQNNAVIYGYKNRYPVAEIENAKENGNVIGDEVGYLGFESGASYLDTEDENNHWFINGVGAFVNTSITAPRSGKYCYQLAAGYYVPQRSFIPTNSNQKFKFSYWIKSTSGVSGSVYCQFNHPTTGAAYTGTISKNFTNTNNVWQLVEFEIDLPAIKTANGLGTSSQIKLSFGFNKTAGVCYLDDIRFHPSVAQMTTSTYTPLVGITSQTDASNRTVYYEYDGVGRLIRTRNEEGYILQEKQYKISGTP